MEKESKGKSTHFTSLADLYRELSLLQIKYENLIDACSALLRPWPSKNAAEVQKEPKTLVDITLKSLEPTTASELDDEPELQALELVLSKAHKVRTEYTKETLTTAKPVQEPKVSFAANMKLAISVYNPAGKKKQPNSQARRLPHKKRSNEGKHCALPAAPTTKLAPQRSQRCPPKVAASSHEVRSPPKAAASSHGVRSLPKAAASSHEVRSPPKAAASSHEVRSPPKAAASSHEVRSPPKAAASSHVVRSPPKVAASSHGAIRGTSKVKKQWHAEIAPVQLHGEESYKTRGTQLSMPPGYHSLQKRLTGVGEHINTLSTSMVSEQFVRRLTSQRRDEQALEVAYLHLLREGYTILKDQLLSQASGCGSWQDVIATKQQLDLIQTQYSTAKDTTAKDTTAKDTTAKDTIAKDTIATHVPLCTQVSQPNIITYSSTKEWQEMAMCEHRSKLQQLELEIVEVCREHVLPKLSLCQCDARSLIEIKRLLRSALGLATTPVISKE